MPKVKQYLTVKEAWNSEEEPKHNELIWEQVNPFEYDTLKFEVVSINVKTWFSKNQPDGKTLKELFKDCATTEQKKYIKIIRKDITNNRDIGYLIVDSALGLVVDGYHRLTALALNGVAEYHKVIDLAKPLE